MKKNIIIGVLLLMTLLFFMYAFVQKAEAEKQVYVAKQQEKIAVENARQAAECKQTAERLQQAMTDALAAAEAQKAIAEKALREANK